MKINFRKTPTCLLLSLALSLAGCNFGHTAEELPQVPSLKDPGFESGLTGWSVVPAFKDQVTVEESLVHGGTKAVRIDATVTHNLPYIAQSVVGLTGGSTYQLSVWARVAPGSPAVTAAVKMETASATKSTGERYGQLLLPADGSWQQVQLQLRVAGDTTRSTLLLRVFGDGAIIFDDATFTQMTPAPDVSVTEPTETSLKPGEESRLMYQLTLRQPWAGPDLPKITARLHSLDETATAEKALSIPTVVKQAEDDQHYTASFTVPKLAAQDYTVNFDYQQKDELLQSVFPAYIFTTLSARQPKSLTRDGTILWHGKPFFPIGIYHPGDYEEIAKNGFKRGARRCYPRLRRTQSEIGFSAEIWPRSGRSTLQRRTGDEKSSQFPGKGQAVLRSSGHPQLEDFR